MVPPNRPTSPPSNECVFVHAERRLSELHYHWHRCLDNYDDPESFRIGLNAAIQAARSVTWLIQKQKTFLNSHPGVYSSWQAVASADSISRWVVKSRNRIVKEEDLETLSYMRVSISATYDDAAALVMSSLKPEQAPDIAGEPIATREFSFPPRMSKKAVLRSLGLKLPEKILRQCSIVVERRWVDRALPGFELLIALSHSYTSMAKLLRDLHEAGGDHHDLNIRGPEQQLATNTDAEDFCNPPCMHTTREYRTHEVDLADDSVFGETIVIREELDPEIAAAGYEKYGQGFSLPADATNAIDYIPSFMATARAIVKSGEEHQCYISFFRGSKPAYFAGIWLTSEASKRRYAQMVAEACALMRYDGVLMVGESWMAPMTADDDGWLVRPKDNPDRSEAIIVDAECSDGARAVGVATFTRDDDGNAVFDSDELVIDHTMKSGFFTPVRRVWESWPKQAATA